MKNASDSFESEAFFLEIFRGCLSLGKSKLSLMNTKRIDADQAPKPVGLYPHARRVGQLLFLSGVGPRTTANEVPGNVYDAEGKLTAYDIEAQCRSVFDNVRKVLEASGASWADLVDVTVFLTNMKQDFPIYNRIYAEYFKDNQPCRTTVEISALPTPIAIELKCVAYLGD
jgi:2-aminomuconate deaminase